jgi:predicted MPP superfamily phosphohydrolase
MSLTVVHMSDLHLGNDIWWRALKAKRKWWNLEVPVEIKDGLIHALSELKPNYVVLSGDFVNDPTPDNFMKAASFLRSVFSKTGINVSTQVLVIPGNHDATLYSKNEDFRLFNYQHFLAELFEQGGRKTRYIKQDHDLKALFLCLDSTLKNKRPLAEGEIGHEQIQWARTNLTEIRKALGEEYRNYARIAVMHHHCKQIKGLKTGEERFMQLLDPEEIIELLKDFDFNLVLHGHKHHPRVDELGVKGESIISVVGAGTAVCPILEEQHQMGNNFNFIRISVETNEVAVQRLKANGQGNFVLDYSQSLPLVAKRSGYTVKEMMKTVTISADGTTRTICSKAGIRTAEKTLRSLPLSISTQAKGAQIKEIRSLHEDAEIVVNNRSNNMLTADLILKQQLTPGREATVAWEHTITGDAAVRRQDLAALYGSEREYDATGVNVAHPAEWFSLEVNFPPGMNVEPYLDIAQFGNPININILTIPKKNHDKILNRFTCRIRNPEAGMRIQLRWVPPEM